MIDQGETITEWIKKLQSNDGNTLSNEFCRASTLII